MLVEKIYKKVQECAICIEQLTRDVITITKCGHLFHKKCITDYFNSNAPKKCPNCRIDFDQNCILSIHYNIDDCVENQNAQKEYDQNVKKIDQYEKEINKLENQNTLYEKKIETKDRELKKFE